MKTSIFQSFFAPISISDFKSEYFNKKVLHLLGNKERTLGFSEEQFFNCLADCENVRAVFKGLLQARIAPNDAKQMVAAGATICASGVENTNLKLKEFLDALKIELCFTGYISIRAYYSPPGNGFDKHYDPRIVTTLQIEGSKTWYYCPVPFDQLPMINSPMPIPISYEEHLDKYGTIKCTLEPGNILCLPAGVIHWAEAGKTNSLSMNIAFDYIGDTIADKIASKVKNMLLKNVEFRNAPFLPLSDEHTKNIKDAISDSISYLENIYNNTNNLYDYDG